MGLVYRARAEVYDMTKLTRQFITDLFTDGCSDLTRYLRSRLPNSEDARDLAQEAYLRLLRLDRNDLVRNPEAYLFRIATNLIHEYWLRGQRSIPKSLEDVDFDTVPSPQDSPETQTGHLEVIEELERTLNLLPALHQQVLLMHRRDGLTYNEIAEKLEISPHMVKKYLIKGLARCRERLRHHRDG